MPIYWPWWLGGACLAVITVGCCVVARRPLGVSGILERFVNLREELAADRTRVLVGRADPAALEAALVAATEKAFGPLGEAEGSARTVEPRRARHPGLQVATAGRSQICGGECASPASRPTIGAHAAFLTSIAAGAFLARLARGTWAPQMDLGPTFEKVVGAGTRGALALVIGGVLVGVGTSVSGGCSTGHGLSGCSRLQPAGIAATASFLATAVLVSFLLEGRLVP